MKECIKNQVDIYIQSGGIITKIPYGKSAFDNLKKINVVKSVRVRSKSTNTLIYNPIDVRYSVMPINMDTTYIPHCKQDIDLM